MVMQIQVFFHGWVRKRWQHNEILYFTVKGRNVEEVQKVRKVFQDHFSLCFTQQDGQKPLLTNLNFNRIGEVENELLVVP